MASINDDEEEESESEDSMEEECTNENANMCFMTLEEHQDKVNSNSNHFEFQDLEKLDFKNISLKKKNSCLQNELNEHNENFENIEKAKISFAKENEELKILKWPKDF